MFKLFGMLENFFYISLGITFALILLLVYHFKQRLSASEKKADTMYEIITGVVQELNAIKSHLHYLEIKQHQNAPTVVQLQPQPVIQETVNNGPVETHVSSDSDIESESEQDSSSESECDSDYESDNDDDDVSVIQYELIENFFYY